MECGAVTVHLGAFSEAVPVFFVYLFEILTLNFRQFRVIMKCLLLQS